MYSKDIVGIGSPLPLPALPEETAKAKDKDRSLEKNN
jgi:hypothetical protein